MEVTVIVATFGEERWAELARSRAVPSAAAQCAQVLHVHGETLHQARNDGAASASGEWLCFLDADDELEPGYLEAMAEAERGAPADALLTPRIRYVAGEFPDADQVPQDFTGRNMRTLNPCPIGTLISRRRFDESGGFWPEPAWEDWSLFRRAWLLGSEVVPVSRAVYRAHSSPHSRNSSTGTQAQRNRLHRVIVTSHARWARTKGIRPR